MVKDRREEPAARDDVADSPQSGEMVIDETPRDHPPTSKAGDTVGGGKVVSKGGEAGERYPQGSSGPGGQYPYPYPGFRGHSGQSVGGPGAPPVTTVTTTSSNASGGRHPQGYEPNVEPVSDDD